MIHSGWQGFLFRVSRRSATVIQGVEVRFWFSDEERDSSLKRKLEEALTLLSRHSPRHLKNFQRDIRGILVTALAAAAKYSRASQLCLLDYDELAREDTTPAVLAGILVHEAAHARLHRLGFRIESLRDYERHEHICIKAELLLAMRLPDGAELQSRASEALAWPASTYSRAARAQRAYERARELGVPDWLAKLLRQRFGLSPPNQEL